MEAEKEQVQREVSVAPTVSREKWAQHAIKKLSQGYVLIVGEQRRNANFYKPGRGYEMCSFQTARQLIREGIVGAATPHTLGTMYLLNPEYMALPKPQPQALFVDDDDDMAGDSLDDSLNLLDGDENQEEEGYSDDTQEEDSYVTNLLIDEDLSDEGPSRPRRR